MSFELYFLNKIGSFDEQRFRYKVFSEATSQPFFISLTEGLHGCMSVDELIKIQSG